MPLIYTGREAPIEGGTSYQAKDGDKNVPVFISDEAIQDYGLSSCQDKGSEKYDDGLVEESGQVRVLTTDFA